MDDRFPELEGITPEAASLLLEGSGRADGVWRSLRSGRDPFEDPALSTRTRRLLRERARAATIQLERSVPSDCGTKKLRLRLADDTRIETVLVPGARRTTVCVSSQAGCARGCIFCATATMGLERNLSASEIVGQVVLAIAEARLASLPPVRNVVFMGMGEPLDNLGPVRAAIGILCHPRALGLGPGHVTLSTVGTTPAAILATGDLPVRLAWSVHAASDALRQRLVPTMRHSMVELREAFLRRRGAGALTLFVEMTLISGLNDEIEHADGLADFLAPFAPRPRINLLPMNPARAGLAPSTESRTVAYRQRLRERGYFCAVRRPRGLSASAACGQLVVAIE